ncbi:phosphohydrolase [Rhodopseudomonas sp. P2A-2r]|uniref:phosphohydrolase n=1 Tax=Rhodopseudomonas sp. P2A-2r TaxID=2991972 RepID=UPI0022342A8F|nr:phosphohydrolase [Rhodopseudomonas sp. P2A-2r]UZE51104.1 phosphohydrolase [Rhodopseudomonas sp. P2A-2r]
MSECDCLAPAAPSPAPSREAPAGRAGDWMQTFTGRQYWPLDPRVDEVDITDIAEALSKLCRYGGHTRRFYSVAEHCVLLARSPICPPRYRFAALMHDASEGYVVDVIRPIKPYLGGYAEIEHANMVVIAERYGFAWPMPPIIKEMDARILHDERDQAMAYPPADWNVPGAALDVQLQFWSPTRACDEFLAAFREFSR